MIGPFDGGPANGQDLAADTLRDFPAPPPSAALRKLVGTSRSLSPRKPLRDLALAILALAGWGAFLAAAIGVRRDLHELPHLRYAVAAGVWSFAACVGLWFVTQPRAGNVLPAGGAVRVGALVLPVVVTSLAVGLLVAGPTTLFPPNVAHYIVHCLSIGLMVSIAPMVLLLVGLRPLLMASPSSIGALVGVVNGALAGLVLHVVCPVGGATHLLGGHAAGMVVAGLCGAGLAQLLVRR